MLKKVKLWKFGKKIKKRMEIAVEVHTNLQCIRTEENQLQQFV
jgi:hypothetical protein